MPIRLSTLPPDIIEHILYECCTTPPINSPCAVTTFSRTCWSLKTTVAALRTSLGARMFAHHFDPPHTHDLDYAQVESSRAAAELVRRAYSLERLRGGALSAQPLSSELVDALSTAYLMMLEDRGRNIAILRRGGLPAALVAFLRHRSLEGDNGLEMWPLLSVVNTLVLALVAGITTSADIDAESDEDQDALQAALAPFVHAEYRYRTSLTRLPTLNAPVAPEAELTAIHYGRRISIVLPPAAISATQILISRMDAHPLQVPSMLHTTRAMALAIQPGFTGITQEDILSVRESTVRRYRAVGSSTKQMWEADWRRAMTYASSAGKPRRAYRIGSLAGDWDGSILMLDVGQYTEMKNRDIPPTNASWITKRPVFVRFREYARSQHAPPMAEPMSNHGVRNAWLPSGFFWNKDGGGIDDAHKDWRSDYIEVTANRSDDEKAWSSSQHVIITGETEEKYRDAWGSFQWTGTVRNSDGQIVLMRRCLDTTTQIFTGYLMADRHLVGRMFITRDYDGFSNADYAAPFSLTRKDEVGV